MRRLFLALLIVLAVLFLVEHRSTSAVLVMTGDVVDWTLAGRSQWPTSRQIQEASESTSVPRTTTEIVTRFDQVLV